MLTGLTVFGAGSLGCGLAPDVPVLVAARVVQGLGAALLLPGTLAIIGRAFPDSAERARAVGVWAGIGSLALLAGPLLGGALTDGLGRRAIFLVNVPIVLLALVWSAAVVRESREDRAPPHVPRTQPKAGASWMNSKGLSAPRRSRSWSPSGTGRWSDTPAGGCVA
ncbi:MFS transporter [Streptomyces collinus]|uniref:MFS transporter n=1 Tax=Streptomyces collinus TaxID=42684 RepID=UPI0033C70C69